MKEINWFNDVYIANTQIFIKIITQNTHAKTNHL